MTTRLLLRGQLAFMREQGFDVTAVASPEPELETVARDEGIEARVFRGLRGVDLALGLARDQGRFRGFSGGHRLLAVNAAAADGGTKATIGRYR